MNKDNMIEVNLSISARPAECLRKCVGNSMGGANANDAIAKNTIGKYDGEDDKKKTKKKLKDNGEKIEEN